METRAHHVLIGLFTVIAVSAALLFGLWLAKSNVDTDFKEYQVVFKEAVTGLSSGSPVQYSGIKVGDVVRLRLDPQDPRRVLAHIRVSQDTPVKRDTVAKLTLNGITGTSMIQLSGGTPQSEHLTGEGGKLPVIIASPSAISRLINDSDDLLNGINTLMASANRMFSPENVQTLTRTLENLEQTTGTIAAQRDDIRQALKQMAVLSKQAGTTLEQTSTLVTNANQLLTHDGAQTIVSARQAMKSLEQSSETISTLLKENQSSVNGGLQGLGELGPAIRELRETLASLKTVSRSLNANPTGYLLGRDKNKEFEP